MKNRELISLQNEQGDRRRLSGDSRRLILPLFLEGAGALSVGKGTRCLLIISLVLMSYQVLITAQVQYVLSQPSGDVLYGFWVVASQVLCGAV